MSANNKEELNKLAAGSQTKHSSSTSDDTAQEQPPPSYLVDRVQNAPIYRYNERQDPNPTRFRPIPILRAGFSTDQPASLLGKRSNYSGSTGNKKIKTPLHPGSITGKRQREDNGVGNTTKYVKHNPPEEKYIGKRKREMLGVDWDAMQHNTKKTRTTYAHASEIAKARSIQRLSSNPGTEGEREAARNRLKRYMHSKRIELGDL